MITKETISKNEFDFSKGEVFLIDKDLGVTSFYIIKRLRKILGIKKIGHAGTLDPAATGLLIVCTGKKTKEIYKYQEKEKTYEGIISLGKTTPSMDSETEVVAEKKTEHITAEQIETVRKSFLGSSTQIPPMYSALKHKGKPLYKYARKGIEIKRKPREIFISNFEINKIDLPNIFFKVDCSKGTYVRVLANDFGEKLGCGAYLKELRRTAIGHFSVDDALTVDRIQDVFVNKAS